METVRVVKLAGTSLDSDARATLELGKADAHGNWPMILHTRGLQQLPEGGYYDLYLTKGGKPRRALRHLQREGRRRSSCTSARPTTSSHFDKDGWVITRQGPENHEPTEVVLKPTAV